MNGWGPKSSIRPSKPGKSNFLARDIPGFCRDIPGAPEKFEKKKFGFNFRSLFIIIYLFFSQPTDSYQAAIGLFLPKSLFWSHAQKNRKSKNKLSPFRTELLPRSSDRNPSESSCKLSPARETPNFYSVFRVLRAFDFEHKLTKHAISTAVSKQHL